MVVTVMKVRPVGMGVPPRPVLVAVTMPRGNWKAGMFMDVVSVVVTMRVLMHKRMVLVSMGMAVQSE